MKKSLLAAAVLLSLLAGCSNSNQNAPASPSPAAAASTPTAAAVPEAIGAVDDISPEQVAYIDYYDDRSPAGVASVTYSKTDAIKDVLNWLAQLKLKGQADDQATGAPGTWGEYQIKLFDGREITVSFNENTVSDDSGRYTFEDPSGQNPADTVYTVWMAPQHRDYPVGTEEIIVELFNQTGGEIAITFVPKLDKKEATGWSTMACASQFCASSDPVDVPVFPMSIDMKTWYPSSPAGTYRLSMEAFDQDGNPLTLACVFNLTEE